MITQERLKELLYYHPESGDFIRLTQSGSAVPGDQCGAPDSRGYLKIRLDGGGQYYSHRLAWLYTHGSWPDDYIDHKNGVKDDNRIANLRPCSNTQNQHNAGLSVTNTSGFKGVCWAKDTGKWQASIRVDGKSKYLGQFNDIEVAANAYRAAAAFYQGEFAH